MRETPIAQLADWLPIQPENVKLSAGSKLLYMP